LSILAWQFGILDALTKQLAGAVTACVTMVRQLSLSQSDFVIFRQRVHEQLEPAVLALRYSPEYPQTHLLQRTRRARPSTPFPRRVPGLAGGWRLGYGMLGISADKPGATW
jgi:hypothetical protein